MKSDISKERIDHEGISDLKIRFPKKRRSNGVGKKYTKKGSVISKMRRLI